MSMRVPCEMSKPLVCLRGRLIARERAVGCSLGLLQGHQFHKHLCSWSRRWDHPLNARESHRLSIGGSLDLCIALCEEAGDKSLQKCERINDLGFTVNSAFAPSANVLNAANKARRMLYFIKRSFKSLTNEIFVSLYSVLVP